MKIAIYGLGNIGIPLACIFASLGKVIGADVDRKKVDMINKGISPLLTISHLHINDMLQTFLVLLL